jgi:toxin YoeB
MSYALDFTDDAKSDLKFHKKSGNKATLKKIVTFLEEITEHPFTGTGKPEPLKHDLSGKWSRRINQEHRLVYEVIETIVKVYSAKGHYD